MSFSILKNKIRWYKLIENDCKSNKVSYSTRAKGRFFYNLTKFRLALSRLIITLGSITLTLPEDKFHSRSLCTLVQMTMNTFIHILVYLIVDALGSHLISCKDCAALSKNMHRVNSVLRSTIFFHLFYFPKMFRECFLFFFFPFPLLKSREISG